MLLAWICGKKPFQCLALACIAASYAPVTAAQRSLKPQAVVARTIILPQEMVVGNPATLAVLDGAGRLMPGAVVQLSTGQKLTTDATGRAIFVAPSEAGALTAKIFGQETSAFAAVESGPTSPERDHVENSATELNQSHYSLSYPKFLALHDRFTIEGAGFNGRADANHVFLADQACFVLASSPVSLVVLPGLHIPIGPVGLRVSVNGYDIGPLPVAAVQLEISGTTEAPNAGGQGRLMLNVRGTKEPLAVEVWNGSPEIIRFPRGTVQRVMTSGGEQNNAPVNLTFLAAGNYTVTARLIPAQSGSAPAAK